MCRRASDLTGLLDEVQNGAGMSSHQIIGLQGHPARRPRGRFLRPWSDRLPHPLANLGEFCLRVADLGLLHVGAELERRIFSFELLRLIERTGSPPYSQGESSRG
jgi:hypothetical protein